MKNEVNIANISRGALLEQFDYEFSKLLENIVDPNTDPKKARKITITLTVKPDETRQLANVSFHAKSSLVPINPVQTNIIIDRDKNGGVVAAELRSEVPGQCEINEKTGEVCNENRVVAMKKGG